MTDDRFAPDHDSAGGGFADRGGERLADITAPKQAKAACFGDPGLAHASDRYLPTDLPIAAASVWPISAGLCTQRIPAAAMTSYFSLAVPVPPLMMAPA